MRPRWCCGRAASSSPSPAAPQRQASGRDLGGETVSLCAELGLAYWQHIVALLAPIDDGQLKPHQRSQPSSCRGGARRGSCTPTFTSSASPPAHPRPRGAKRGPRGEVRSMTTRARHHRADDVAGEAQPLPRRRRAVRVARRRSARDRSRAAPHTQRRTENASPHTATTNTKGGAPMAELTPLSVWPVAQQLAA